MTLKLSKFFSFAVALFFSISVSFTQSNPVFSPKFSHLSGRYNSNIQVQLTSATTNGSIYYTLDGSTPTSSSPLYTGAIPVTGNGNQVTVKAVTITSGSAKSFVSSATYVIDFSYDPNASYLTNLSWAQYNSYLSGNWFGYASTPWTCNYSVKLSILPNGNYIDTATSTSCFSQSSDFFHPVFYYGTRDASSLKNISLYNILGSGYANGFITIDFGSGSTNQYELRYIKFTDENNLYIEMWHQSNGPLKYYLTKNRQILSTDDSNSAAQVRIYPNPTSDFLVIENLGSDVQMTNQLGQTITLEKSAKIPVSHVSKGLYFVQFKNLSGEQIRQKVVIE